MIVIFATAPRSAKTVQTVKKRRKKNQNGPVSELCRQLRGGGDAPEPHCAASLPRPSVLTGRSCSQQGEGWQPWAALGALVPQDYLQPGWQVNGIAYCHLQPS